MPDFCICRILKYCSIDRLYVWFLINKFEAKELRSMVASGPFLFPILASAGGGMDPPAPSPLALGHGPPNDTSINPSMTTPVIYGNGVTTTFRPGIALIIGVLSVMFSVTFLLLLYAKHCKRNTVSTFDDPAAPPAVARARISGVDRAVIEALPIFKFASLQGIKEGLECAVCLSKFEESEILRLLPKCKHAFHIGCVDAWLDAHSTCPLCRHRVEPEDVYLVEDIVPRRKSAALDVDGAVISSRNSTDVIADRDGSVHLCIQRENESLTEGSARFSVEYSSFRKSDRFGSGRRTLKTDSLGSGRRESVGIGCLPKIGSRRKDELLLADELYDKEYSHRFGHRIIISDVIFQHRWSDFNPSDALLLSKHTLMSSAGSPRLSFSDRNTPDLFNAITTADVGSSTVKEISVTIDNHRNLEAPGRSSSGSPGINTAERLPKIKEGMERKRKLDKQASRLNKSSSVNPAEKLSDNAIPEDVQQDCRPGGCNGRSLIASSNRSMSEITGFHRLPGPRMNRNVHPFLPRGYQYLSFANSRDEEKMRRWLSIASRTVQWLAGREKRSPGEDGRSNSPHL